MNALGRLSPATSLLALFVGSLLTSARHLSGFAWAGVPKRSVGLQAAHARPPFPPRGWDHCEVAPAFLQLLGGGASTRGQLAAGLCQSWSPLAYVPALAAVPQAQGLCPAASRGWPSPLIPSDIWPRFRPWPALLCLCLRLGTANAGAKRTIVPGSWVPEVLPGPSAR